MTDSFPFACIVVEFITAKVSPFGTWGSLAYTQYGNRPLMQLASYSTPTQHTYKLRHSQVVLGNSASAYQAKRPNYHQAFGHHPRFLRPAYTKGSIGFESPANWPKILRQRHFALLFDAS